MNSQANEDHISNGADSALMLATSAAILTLLPIAASQLGFIERLPDLPGSIFDTKHIIGSKQAHPLGIPDSLLGIGSYGATLTLVLLARTRPSARKLLAAKLVADGAAASFNTVRQMSSFRKLCSWCLGTAVSTAFMVIAGRRVISDSMRLLRSGQRHS